MVGVSSDGQGRQKYSEDRDHHPSGPFADPQIWGSRLKRIASAASVDIIAARQPHGAKG